MPFFHYSQNNSGGSFVFDPERKITHHMVIEADSASDANDRAELIGLYFDGAGDCPCCGNRWCAQWSSKKGDLEPRVYDKPVAEYSIFLYKWINGPEIYVHHKDGRVEEFLP